MAVKKTRNEEYDALNGWREENFGSYAGGSEYDPTVEAILAYERQKAAAKKSQAESEDVMGPN